LTFLLAIISVLTAVEALRRAGAIADSNKMLRRDIERLSNDVVALKQSLHGVTVPPAEQSKTPVTAQAAQADPIQAEAVAERREEAVDEESDVESLTLNAQTELASEKTPDTAAATSANWDGFKRFEDISGIAVGPKPPISRKGTLQDIEQLLAGRWFVILGGVAIALAGLLFVKYAHDNGLIPPWLRILIGYGFSGALVAGGEYVRRKRNPDIVDHVPAALSAAGIVTAFGVTYAAYSLYDLFSPGVCFPLLVVIGLGAIWLSRLQGPLIAALGLIGSYVAPAVVPSEHPSAWGFFAYLLVIAVACFYELRNRPWWWLGFSAVAGALAWSMLWIGSSLFDPAHTIPASGFAFALALAATFIPRGTATLQAEGVSGEKLPEPPQQIAMAAGGASTLILMALVFTTHHSTTALTFFAAGMAGVAAFGWGKQHINIAAPLAALISLIVLMAWPDVSTLYPAFDDRGFWTLVPGLVEPPRFVHWMIAAGTGFTLLGLAGSLRKLQPPFWDALAAASAVCFLFGAWAQADFAYSNTTWIMLALAGAALLTGTAYRMKGRISDSFVEASIVYFAIAATALMLFAADRLFDDLWYTLSIAGLALAASLVPRSINHRIFGMIAAFLASLASLKLFLAREFWTLPSLPLGDHWPLYGYGLPAIAFWLAARNLPQARDEKSRISLEGLSLGLLISLASLELRVLIGGGVTQEQFSFLELSSHAATWLAAAFGLAYRQKVYSGFVARWGVLALTAAACVLLLMMLVPMNPAITGDTIAGHSVINTLWLAYALPAALLYVIASRLPGLGWVKFVKPLLGLIIALAAAFVSLMIRRWFQGPQLDFYFANFTEICALMLAWIASALAANEWNRKAKSDLACWMSLTFTALATGIFVMVLTLENPIFGAHPLMPNAFVNPLWLAYVLPTLSVALLINRNTFLSAAPYREALGGLGFASVMMFATLIVKRFYQGPVLEPNFLSDAENYSVSLVWLALGIIAFIGGLKTDRQYVRVAALFILALTVLKVFIYDFAELSGLWRIASLLGLGLCLVGIGWLYSRFVHKASSAPADSTVAKT
jgi:uncharacterized membrane protein